MKQGIKFGAVLVLLLIGFGVGLNVSKFSNLSELSTLPKLKMNDGSEYDHRQPAEPSLERLFPDLVIRQGKSKAKTIALTFDDGPDMHYTPWILDVLKQNRVKATFFVVGAQIEKYPAVFKRIIREGHAIGNHGYRHLNFARQTEAVDKYLLSRNEALFNKYGVRSAHLFRPPYGAISPKMVQLIGGEGFKIILWTIDSLDWRGLKEKQVLANVTPDLKPGFIILQHSFSGGKKEDLTGSVLALPFIIAKARQQGYRLVTIPELLREK